MDFIDMLLAVIIGNFLTVMVIYIIWRARRDDGWITIILGLATCAVIGWIGWSAKPESTRQAYQSVIAGSGN